MAGAASGIGFAGSSFVTFSPRISSFLSHDPLSLQASPTTTILESTRAKISTIAASIQTTTSWTMATRWKCGPASYPALQSTHSFVVSTLLTYPSSLNTSCDSLATETEYVRYRLAEYSNDLLSLGVDGLRLDASKRTHLNSLRVEVCRIQNIFL